MSGGPRPPVPGLIPLAALSRRPARPRRRLETIDADAGSRGLETRAAAPGRRRHRRRAAAVGKQSRSSSPALDRPPRVNPIFVWVRQEDTRIVDVKCEDYDKRNRILLTKTAHGWRAIPRTEMLGAPRASAEQAPSAGQSPVTHHGHHHRHHHKRRSRKSKNQQSTSVQFPDPESSSEPSWVTSENVNIESLLPSHTIHVKRTESSDELLKSVNSVPEQEFARTITECSTPDKVCDVSPLENLLAVAELELKQHMQSGKWVEPQEQSESIKDTNVSVNPSIEEIDELLKTKSHEMQIDQKSPEYNDDDEMSMNDILSRLEQSLQSPQGFGSDNTFDDEISEQDSKSDKVFSNSDENNKSRPDKYVNMPEPSQSYDVEVKEEYTENETMEFSQIDHYTHEVETVENKDSENGTEYIEPSDIKDDCSLPDTVNLENDCVKSVDRISYKSEDNEEMTEDFEESIITDSNIKNNYVDSIDSQGDIILHLDESMTKSDNKEKISQENTSLDKNDIEGKQCSYQSQQEKEYEAVQSPIEFENKIAEAESSTAQEDHMIPQEDDQAEEELAMCLDLSIKKTLGLTINTVMNMTSNTCDENSEGPTDLSVRKHQMSPRSDLAMPESQSSETSQSPQPSGIPAVPPSPDIVSTSISVPRPRSAFLESLLANTVNKMPLNSSGINNKQKEPLDLGKCRKSASPTVTCSEEIITPSSEAEPPPKKLKPDEITLKNLLDKDVDRLEHTLKKISSKETKALPETPRLLSLLKASSDTQDPLAEYKQLLVEIDIPNPLMVPKDYFPDLLKYPRREILKILSGQSNKNVPLDDILVVYRDKLLAAIEASLNNSTTNNTNNDGLKVANRTSVPKSIEKNNNNNNEKSTHIPSKRKSTEITNKGLIISPDSKSSLANDIDAANEAALFWAGCPNPFEAMASYSSHNDFIQALYAASSLPYLPGQLGEMHPGLQMMLGNKMGPQLSFPPPPPINFNNPFELSMWQEAMMQASMLKNKNPYENSILNQPNYRANIENKRTQLHQNHTNKLNQRHPANGHCKNTPQSQPIQQQSFLQSSYGQAILGNEPGWQNPYLGISGFQQGSNNLTLNLPQFNPFSHRNNLSPTNKHSQQLSPSVLHKQNKEASLMTQFNEQEKRLHRQMMQEQQKLQQTQQQKMLRQQQHQQLIHQQQHMLRQSNGHKQQLSSPLGKKHFSSSKDCIQDKSLTSDSHKAGNLQGPIDLSGAQNVKAKRHLSITANSKSNSTVTSSKSIADDVPEVGSTTGNIEEMQDAHAQLWHPLFGSQNKGYNPWNLPSLTAMGE